MVGAELAGKVELGVFQIDRDDRGPRDLGVLHRQVAQAPDAENRDQVQDLAPETLTALYVVTPAQLRGAASKEEMPSGTGTTKSAEATAYSA